MVNHSAHTQHPPRWSTYPMITVWWSGKPFENPCYYIMHVQVLVSSIIGCSWELIKPKRPRFGLVQSIFKSGNNHLSILHLRDVDHAHTLASACTVMVAFLTSLVPEAVKSSDKPLPLQLDRRFSLQPNTNVIYDKGLYIDIQKPGGPEYDKCYVLQL